MMEASRPGEPVIIALDVGSRQDALSLVDPLRGMCGMFKVGLELFVAEGPDVVRAIIERGERVFLDLKLHDIPNTASRSAVEAGKHGASMITIHGSGGAEMVAATVRGLEDRFGRARPIVSVVTVLTSMDEANLTRTGVPGSPRDQVLRIADIAQEAGADGLICSPLEVGLLRQRLGRGMKLTTPGVRMPGQSADDQKRIATPGEALRDGADWIVIGRYVNQAADPRKALLEVIAALDTAVRTRS